MQLFKEDPIRPITLEELYKQDNNPSGNNIVNPKITGGIMYGTEFRSVSSGATLEILPSIDPTVGLRIKSATGVNVLLVNIDGSDTGDITIGNYSGGQGMKYDSSADTFTITGALSAGTIDIGGSDASSFHVDSGGNTWWGAATLANGIASIDSSGNMSISSLSRKDFHWFTLFESMDGYQHGGVGAETIAFEAGTLAFTTDVHTNDTAFINKIMPSGTLGFTWSKRRNIKLGVKFAVIGNNSFYLRSGSSDTNSARHIGFLLSNNTLYGTVGDGSDYTTVEYGVVTEGNNYDLEARYIPATSCEFFVNGTSIGTATTNLPSGATSSNDIIDIKIKTDEDSAKKMYISYYDFWQAN